MVCVARTSPLTVAVVAAVAIGGACDCGEEGFVPEVPPAVVDAPPPPGLLWEASLGGGDSVLAALRDGVGGPARLLVPASVDGLFARYAGSGPWTGQVRSEGPLWAVAARTDDGWKMAVAAPVDMPEVDLGAPRGPGEPVVARAGDWIVAADDEVALEHLRLYLVHDLARRSDVPAGLRVRLTSLATDELRTEARTQVRSHAARLTALAREERSRHTDAPTFGEPEALVARVASTIEGLLAHLPDLVEPVAELVPTEIGVELTLTAHPRPGSPLAETLTALGPVPASQILGALRPSTAVGTAWRTDPGDAWLAEVVGEIAGARMAEAERAALGDALARIDAARGDTPTTLVAAGAGVEGPWLGWASTMERTTTERTNGGADVLGALESRFLPEVLGALLGCPRAIAPRLGAPRRAAPRGATARGDDRSTITLCGPNAPALAVTGRESVLAVALARDHGATVDRELAAALDGHSVGGSIDGQPDAARALEVIRSAEDDDRVVGAALLVPSRLVPALGLFDVGPLRRASEGLGATNVSAPIVLSLERGSDAAYSLRLVLTRAAARDLSDTVMPWIAAD
jgi:hypothetical protein